MYLGKVLLRICLVYIMDIENEDVQNRRGNGIIPPCAGLTPNALPEVQTPSEEENSQTGVSTRNALPRKFPESNPTKEFPHWYAIRCTYGRERKAYEFFSKQGIEAFYPTITSTKTIDGKKETIEESRLPNILFAFGTFEQLKVYVYDNHHDEVTTDNLDDAYTGFFLVTSKESSLYGIKKALGGKFVELEVHCEDAYYKEIDGDFHHWNDPDKG